VGSTRGGRVRLRSSFLLRPGREGLLSGATDGKAREFDGARMGCGRGYDDKVRPGSPLAYEPVPSMDSYAVSLGGESHCAGEAGRSPHLVGLVEEKESGWAYGPGATHSDGEV